MTKRRLLFLVSYVFLGIVYRISYCIIILCISVEVSIAYLEGKSINFENLVKQLHTSLGSRSTIASVLEDYIYKKFMIKRACKKDKRWRVYEPTKVALHELNRYLERRHRMLREVA